MEHLMYTILNINLYQLAYKYTVMFDPFNLQTYSYLFMEDLSKIPYTNK